MARVDSLLSILSQQGANELRLGTDREPKMLAFGSPRRLSIPSTPEDTLRELLGDILSAERERQLASQGKLEVAYASAGSGTFQVRLAVRAEGGFDAVFVRDAARRPLVPQPAAPAPLAQALVPAAPASAPAPPPRVTPGPETSGPSELALAPLVLAAAALGASDLHLADGAPPVVRVDGALRRLSDEPVDLLAVLGLGPVVEARLAGGRSLDASAEVPGAGRVRIHVFRTHEGLAASVRLLPGAAPPLASLHLPVVLDDLAELRDGLVLLCGATGSGKSTTLAALAQEALRRRSIVLTTLEDPIEHVLSPTEVSIVRRRQVGVDVADFASGLRDALREDPDVLLVGEMRDPETIGLALTAAETGHLVLSSLHSRSAASTVERIVDAYPPERQAQIRAQLADALRAIVVQRLVPRAGGPGRVPCVEVLRGTHAVAALVREGRTAQIPTAIQSGRRDGMLTLERCLADRVRAGEIRVEDARAVANEPASLAMHLGRGEP